MGTETYVQLPSDSTNAGKKVRAISKTVNAVTGVMQNVYALDRKATVLGIYGASLGTVLSVKDNASAQNGTTTAMFWWSVPNTVTGKAARMRSCILKFTTSAVTPVMLTIPRIVLGKWTFTGNMSGSQITAVPFQTSYPADVTYLSAAITGATPTLVNSGTGIGCATVPPALLAGTAASFQMPIMDTQQLIPQGQDNEDLWPLCNPGEGLVLFQIDAGTASEIRRFTCDIIYDVIDTSGA
jgi:hypothetical protein